MSNLLTFKTISLSIIFDLTTDKAVRLKPFNLLFVYQVFTDLLAHESAVIRAKAARDIMDLSVPLDGKDKAVEVKCVPILVKLLKVHSPLNFEVNHFLSFDAFSHEGVESQV